MIMSDIKSTFETLEVWIKSRELRNKISKLSTEFPSEEKYRLSDQMIRASRSVTANIAEGYGRFHYQENIQFCRQARGSLFELVDHLSVSLDENYIDGKIYKNLKSDILEIIRLLNGYIKYLKTKKGDKRVE
jgi:four helix bundle protein